MPYFPASNFELDNLIFETPCMIEFKSVVRATEHDDKSKRGDYNTVHLFIDE